MHAAADHGVGVLNLIYPLLNNPDWPKQRKRMTKLLNTMLTEGKAEGSLRPDTQANDIVFATIRFSRPVSVGLSRADERTIAHRHSTFTSTAYKTTPEHGRKVSERVNRGPGIRNR